MTNKELQDFLSKYPDELDVCLADLGQLDCPRKLMNHELEIQTSKYRIRDDELGIVKFASGCIIKIGYEG